MSAKGDFKEAKGETPSCKATHIKPNVKVVEDGFGFLKKEDGTSEAVKRFTLTNQSKMSVQIMTYGATITSIKCPDAEGVIDDVVLGFDTFDGYLTKSNPYFGALVGRFANRISKGHFKLKGNEGCAKDYQVSINHNGKHHLHGGFKGFDKVNWKADVQGDKVVLTYLSKDGEEGYPGDVLVSAIYSLSDSNELTLEMRATTTKPTPINLTNHSYFNLAGHDKGSAGFYQHLISVNADKYVMTDDDSIPTGMLKPVGGTLWDLRIPRLMSDVMKFVPRGGYDQCLCVHRTDEECYTFVARVIHPESKRTLELYSNQPGVQLYTSNYFPTNPRLDKGTAHHPTVRDKDKEIIGRKGVHYYKHQAFCLETQTYPDAMNHKHFPNSILRPGEEYHHKVTYKFGLFEEPDLEPEEKEVYTTEFVGEGEELKPAVKG